MENRSFDHFLGWVPGADGKQAGIRLVDVAGEAHESYDLAPNFQNCRFADPDHSYEGGRREINAGAMDGFLLTQPQGDTFPIGYYTGESLPFFRGCAENWTICDQYFSGILSSTTPSRTCLSMSSHAREEAPLQLCTHVLGRRTAAVPVARDQRDVQVLDQRVEETALEFVIGD